MSDEMEIACAIHKVAEAILELQAQRSIAHEIANTISVLAGEINSKITIEEVEE